MKSVQQQSGVQTAATCWTLGNGLQGQAVHTVSWDKVWWEGSATWEEPEMTEENTQQHFADSIEVNGFLFYDSCEWRTFVQSVPQMSGNLLENSKWVGCSPFHLICNLFLVSSSAVDLANDFLKLFQYSWHESNSTYSLMPRFGSFLKVFDCPIFFLEDGLH